MRPRRSGQLLRIAAGATMVAAILVVLLILLRILAYTTPLDTSLIRANGDRQIVGVFEVDQEPTSFRVLLLLRRDGEFVRASLNSPGGFEAGVVPFAENARAAVELRDCLGGKWHSSRVSANRYYEAILDIGGSVVTLQHADSERDARWECVEDLLLVIRPLPGVPSEVPLADRAPLMRLPHDF